MSDKKKTVQNKKSDVQVSKKSKQTRLIIINLCVAAILAIIAGSIAAYTSLSSAKRVVSTKGTSQLFSSNVLYTFESEADISNRVMSFSNSSESFSFTFTICNFAQGLKTDWSSKDINYSLSVTLIDDSKNKVTDDEVLKEYKISYSSTYYAASSMNESNSETSSESTAQTDDDQYDTKISFTDYNNITSSDNKIFKLKNDTSGCTEHTYQITIPSEFIENYNVKIVATSDVSNYSSIGRIISFSESTSSTHWSIQFTDGIFNDDAHTPSELGSVNVKIYGQEHEYAILSWDTNYFEIDPWFLEDLKEELNDLGLSDYSLSGPDSDGFKTLKFEVGNEEQPKQYYISFYRTQSAKSIKDETWAKIEERITLSRETITTEQGDGSTEDDKQQSSTEQTEDDQ